MAYIYKEEREAKLAKDICGIREDFASHDRMDLLGEFRSESAPHRCGQRQHLGRIFALNVARVNMEYFLLKGSVLLVSTRRP